MKPIPTVESVYDVAGRGDLLVEAQGGEVLSRRERERTDSESRKLLS